MDRKCTCDPPCLVPLMAHEGGTQRNHIGCVACGVRWAEQDAALVEEVWAAQEKWEREERAREQRVQAKPECQRFRGSCEYVPLLGGDQMCRHCGARREQS